MAQKHSWKGPLFVILSAVAWSFSGVLSTGISWNGFSKNGARAIIAVLIYAAIRRSFRVKLTRSTVIGGLGVMLTSALYMIALSYTSSANAIILQYSMPAFVVLIDWLRFHIRPARRDVAAVVFVALGVVLCCAQNLSGGAFFGDLLSVLSGLTFAIVFIASRAKDSSVSDYTYLGILMCVPGAISLFFDPNVHFAVSQTVSAAILAREWLSAVAMGLSLVGGYVFLAIGMRDTRPITAAILENLEPVLNPVWVFLFYGKDPGLYTILGAAVVLITVTAYTCLPLLRDKRAPS